MALNLKSISRFSWPKRSFMSKLQAYPWKSISQTIFRKVLALIFSILFFILSLFFLGYAIVEITTNMAGVNAQVADISNFSDKPLEKYRSMYEAVGLYKVAVIKDHVEYKNVICLYPARPNHVELVTDNLVKVWPRNKPFVAAAPMRVQGWMVLVFFLVVGLAILINLKSTTRFLWSQESFAAELGDYTWKSLLRIILLKVLVVILSILFLILSFLFLSYAFIEITANTAGVSAQVADVSSFHNMPVGKHRLRYETVGLFKAVVIKDNVEYKDVICLYPAWPNHVDPAMENMVKVWPEKKPLVAATQMQVLGWVVSFFFLLVGLAMFEFFLLVWTIH
jgi:ABC-type antimicrobial peptide transport system permease subunit